jgi:hypothetical protein
MAGLLVGSVLGVGVLIAAIMLTDSTFGLTNVWPGAAVGAILGVLLGLALPERLLTVYRRVFRG